MTFPTCIVLVHWEPIKARAYGVYKPMIEVCRGQTAEVLLCPLFEGFIAMIVKLHVLMQAQLTLCTPEASNMLAIAVFSGI